MINYKTHISTLLSENFRDESNRASNIRVTAYIPIDPALDEFYEKLEIKLFNHLSSLPHLKKKLNLIRSFLETFVVGIKDRIQEVEYPVESVALYLDVNTQPVGLEDFCDYKLILPLHIGIAEEWCEQNIYCLDQLIAADNQDPKVVSLVFQRENVMVYQIERNTVTDTYEIETPYKYEEDSEYLNQYMGRTSPGGNLKSRKIVHGTGASTLERDFSRHDYEFIKKVKKRLQKHYEIEDVRYAVIFHSENLSEFIEKFDFEEKLKDGVTTLYKDNVPQTKSEITDRSWDVVSEYMEEMKEEKLRLAKDENWAKYITGWKDVSAAARERKIDTLFINPEVVRPGFILDNQYVYSYPVGESKKVKNISPWIVSTVLNSSGKVFPVDSGEFPNGVSIVAKVRY